MNALPYFLIAGATASGKSELAIALAEQCRGEIVCADAFQIYKGLENLTAAPDQNQKIRCPHHLFGIVSPTETFDVARYLSVLHPCLRAIRERGNLPIIVGGTGLYFRALVQGLSPLPQSDAQLREELEAHPVEWRLNKLQELDPQGWQRVDIQNPRRVLRALEVCLLSGKPVSELRQALPPEHYAWHGVYLEREREVLSERILRRTQAMLRGAAIEEVQYWKNNIGTSARSAIGFREIEAMLNGESTKEETIEKIVIATRQYAKRQRTWFRNQTRLPSFFWEKSAETDLMIEKLLCLISSAFSQ